MSRYVSLRSSLGKNELGPEKLHLRYVCITHQREATAAEKKRAGHIDILRGGWGMHVVFHLTDLYSAI